MMTVMVDAFCVLLLEMVGPSFSNGFFAQNLPNFMNLLATLVVFAAAIYLQGFCLRSGWSAPSMLSVESIFSNSALLKQGMPLVHDKRL